MPNMSLYLVSESKIRGLHQNDSRGVTMKQLSNVIGVDMIKKEVGGRHTKGNIRSERLGPEKPSRSYKIIRQVLSPCKF